MGPTRDKKILTPDAVLAGAGARTVFCTQKARVRDPEAGEERREEVEKRGREVPVLGGCVNGPFNVGTE